MGALGRMPEVNFNYGTPVITAAQLFVIPVPALSKGGERLVHPEECGHLTDGRGIGAGKYRFFEGRERGIVYGQSGRLVGGGHHWFGARGDGSMAIAINEVTEQKADMLIGRLQEIGRPEEMTLRSLREFLKYADTLGVGTMSACDRSRVKQHMTPVKPGERVIGAFGELYGHMRKAAHTVFDLTVATYVDTPFELGGDAFEEGGVATYAQGKALTVWSPAEFIEGHRLQWDGARITDLARQIYRHGDEKAYEKNDYDPEVTRPGTAWLIRIKDE